MEDVDTHTKEIDIILLELHPNYCTRKSENGIYLGHFFYINGNISYKAWTNVSDIGLVRCKKCILSTSKWVLYANCYFWMAKSGNGDQYDIFTVFVNNGGRGKFFGYME